ncbi:MAG: hypothetical protein IVW57_14250, partial [Ktedonobacterales bacterium]|nr:hypothetical protein [Ktedonobacterales bacterium]
VYLSALFLATASYFAGRALGADASFLWYVALAEAAAVELHSFLSQRMARSLHEQRTAPAAWQMPYDARDALERRYTLHLRITVGLVLFSVLNSVGFWAALLRPASVLDWLQVAVRGAVIPVAFLAAGFLMPLHESVESTLQDVGADLVRTMVRASTRQWRTRVKRARKRGANLAEPVAMLLEMQEGGEHVPASVMIRTLDAAIRTAEGGASRVPLPSPITPSGMPPDLTRPPTGPGTPTAAPLTAEDARESAPRRGRASKRGRPGRERRQVLALPAAGKGSAEERIRAMVARYPSISVRTLAKRAGVSESTASKHRALILAEREREEERGQVAR